jgi:hypothetical protein
MPAPESYYYTPAACVDLPFLYVFDASKLTDGTTPAPLIVPIVSDSDADFMLRAILGVPNCIDTAANGGGFVLYNYSGSQAFSIPYSPFSNHYSVVPEKFYPRFGAIKFLLQKVLRANTACTVNAVPLPIYYSQIGFQGIKRYTPGDPTYHPGSPALPPPYDPDDYILRPYSYLFTLNLNWFAWTAAGLAQIPRTFTVEIQDYDFELHQISVVNATTGAVPTTELCQVQLYDATAKRALSSAPVNLSFLNAVRSAYSPVFPVPPVVYPVWTQIRFDVTSLVCNSDGSSPYSLQFLFTGVNRIPKLTSTANTPTNVVVSGAGA